MGIDIKYIPLNYLQQYFVDKTDGFPLAGGQVTFYKDQARTQLKDIYAISGTPPNYTYVLLPNPMILSSVGTFVDNSGQDVTVYAYPYDSNNDVELYFITVYSATGDFQWSRQGVPNIGSVPQTTVEITNFIPNGQFLLHNDIPASLTTVAGQVTQGITQIAQGGWTFERPGASTATDLVTFKQYLSPLSNPTGNPRYAARIRCTNPIPGDSYKGLRVKFPDVNRFASATQEWTFSFTAQSASPSTAIIVNLIKNYGTVGGSPTETIPLASLSIGTTSTIYNIPFIYGNNATKTIGNLDNDYCQFDIEVPPTSVCDINFTDVVLTPGNIDITQFPTETNADFLYQSLPGWLPTPAHDGSDLYCGLRLTASGLEFDHSDIGSCLYTVNDTIPVGYLLADGTQLLTDGYSADGIPYSRLQSICWLSALNVPKYGTGEDYFTSVFSGTGSTFNLVNNSAGAVTATADGAIPTTFTFSTIHPGDSGYGAKAYLVDTDTFVIEPNIAFHDTPSTAGTSPFTVLTIQNGETSSAQQKAPVKVATTVNITLSGEQTVDGVLTSGSRVLVWKQSNSKNNGIYVSAAGAWTRSADANTGASLVKCAVSVTSGTKYHGYSFYNTNTSIILGSTAINFSLSSSGLVGQKQLTQIQTIDGSLLTGGQYFRFYTYDVTTNAEIGYYLWYKVNLVGADPAPSGLTGIEVDLLSTDTADIIAQKIQESFNGWNLTVITAKAGSMITPGSYFTASSSTSDFYVWYNVDGAGTDPAISLTTGIEVDVLSTDSATVVAAKTQIAINSKYYALPDFRGLFLRGTNYGTTNDPDADSRWSMVPGIIGDMTGTMQTDALKYHGHWQSNLGYLNGSSDGIMNSFVGAGKQAGPGTPAYSPGANPFVPLIQQTGTSQQSYPINSAVNILIKY